MSAIIETLLSVGKALFGLRGELAKARADRKKEVADFIDAIASTIAGTAESLRANQFPAGMCAELAAHAQHMNEAVGDLIGSARSTELSARLQEIWAIEQLFAELQTDTAPERSRKLLLLDEAAGQFRATAAFVRVSP